MSVPVAKARASDDSSSAPPAAAPGADGAGVLATESSGVLSPVVFAVLGSEKVDVTCAGIAEAGATAGAEGGSFGAIVPSPPPTLERDPDMGAGAAGAL